LEWVIIADLDNETKPLDPEFEVAGIRVQPLRLYHGGTYICLGFVFGEEGSRVAYLSDVKVIPPPTLEYLRSITIDTLILDALFVDRKHSTHFNLHEALEAIEILKPKRTILTGMTHEFNYYTKNAELQQLKNKEGQAIDVCVGYDGMEIPVNL
jgi:phosphoribosyl 1,2-cyclic phosphodiesterase